MESDVLAKILQAEREIQTNIDAAAKSCREHLQRLQEEAEKRLAQEESLIRDQCRRALQEADDLARKQAAAVLDTETQRAEKLCSLADEALKRVIMRHIIGILPGEKA